MNTKTVVFDTTSTSTSKTTTAMFCTTSVPPSLYCRHFTLCLIKCLSRACVCAQSQSARTMHLCTCCVGMVLPLCCTLNLMRLALLLRLLYFAYGSYQAMFICLYTLKLALSQLLEFSLSHQMEQQKDCKQKINSGIFRFGAVQHNELVSLNTMSANTLIKCTSNAYA